MAQSLCLTCSMAANSLSFIISCWHQIVKKAALVSNLIPVSTCQFILNFYISACSFVTDHTPDLRHLHSRDTSYALVSRAPIDKIMAFKKRRGWDDNIPWYSSFGQDFNYDFHVTIDESVRPIQYNYDDKEAIVNKGDTYRLSGEQSGFSVFYAEGGDVYHTYSAYGRGAEGFLNTYFLLDITPLGRQEPNEGPWGKVDAFLHHDKYTDKTYTGTRELASA